jgi:hypothetical protein
MPRTKACKKYFLEPRNFFPPPFVVQHSPILTPCFLFVVFLCPSPHQFFVSSTLFSDTMIWNTQVD